jgi:hypothetical protein
VKLIEQSISFVFDAFIVGNGKRVSVVVNTVESLQVLSFIVTEYLILDVGVAIGLLMFGLLKEGEGCHVYEVPPEAFN